MTESSTLLAAGKAMYRMTPTEYEPSDAEYIAATKAALRVLATSPAVIQTMARALCQIDEDEGGPTWNWYYEQGRDAYRKRAKAALEALQKL